MVKLLVPAVIGWKVRPAVLAMANWGIVPGLPLTVPTEVVPLVTAKEIGAACGPRLTWVTAVREPGFRSRRLALRAVAEENVVVLNEPVANAIPVGYSDGVPVPFE